MPNGHTRTCSAGSRSSGSATSCWPWCAAVAVPRGDPAGSVRGTARRGAAEIAAGPSRTAAADRGRGDGRQKSETAEIAHEAALLREWPRFATWVDDDADFQHWLTCRWRNARRKATCCQTPGSPRPTGG